MPRVNLNKVVITEIKINPPKDSSEEQPPPSPHRTSAMVYAMTKSVSLRRREGHQLMQQQPGRLLELMSTDLELMKAQARKAYDMLGDILKAVEAHSDAANCTRNAWNFARHEENRAPMEEDGEEDGM